MYLVPGYLDTTVDLNLVLPRLLNLVRVIPISSVVSGYVLLARYVLEPKFTMTLGESIDETGRIH